MRFSICLLVLLLAPWALFGQGQPPITCGNLTTCAEVASFISAITDFRSIVQNTTNKTVTIRTSFRNKLNRPLIIGYVQGSGVATDDRGKRYVVYGAQAVRGIGEIAGSSLDPKFILQPGEASDARFEFLWRSSGQEIFGLNFEIDLTIREIEAFPGNQFRLGREHALHFSGFSAGATTTAVPAVRPVAAVTAPPPAAAPAPSAPTPPVEQADACGGRPQCYSAGLFTAEVTGLTPSQAGAYRVMQASVRFRNLTNQPIILAYVGRSAVITDNLGNRYGAKDDGINGMGTVMGGSADPQFVLNAGASFNFDVTIAQLEMMQSQQIRTVGEYTVGFTELGASAMSAVAAAPNNMNDSVKKLGDIFRGGGKKK
jgi:hypothetical protein